MMFKRKKSILVPVILLCWTIIVDVQSQTHDEMSQAGKAVADFETQLMQQMSTAKYNNESKNSEKLDRLIREFFAALDGRAMKLAAMDLLDNRYVYIVNRKLVVELLGPLIHDADPAVQARAAKAIGYNLCGAQYVDELTGILEGKPSTKALVNVAYAMGRSSHQPFVTHLVKLLSHADEQVRATVSFELTRLAPKQALEFNLKLLSDSHASVRGTATQNLVHTPEQRVITAVEGMLNDEEYKVREQAVLALGQMQSQSSAADIVKLLKDLDHRVRGKAALVLGQMQAIHFAEDVLVLLKDEDVVTRRYAVKAFGAMGAPRYIDDLRALLNDVDDQVRSYAAAAISELEAVKAGRLEPTTSEKY